MKRYAVIFLPDEERRLADIETYIAERAGSSVAERFVEGVIARAQRLSAFPLRGTPRDDLQAGLRTVIHRRIVTIAYVVEGDRVAVTDFLYKGEDIPARFNR